MALEHVMVPKHELLPEKEVDKMLKELNVSRIQLPTILIADPALQGLDVKNGDVIRITRENPVTGTSYAYRLVSGL